MSDKITNKFKIDYANISKKEFNELFAAKTYYKIEYKWMQVVAFWNDLNLINPWGESFNVVHSMAGFTPNISQSISNLIDHKNLLDNVDRQAFRKELLNYSNIFTKSLEDAVEKVNYVTEKTANDIFWCFTVQVKSRQPWMINEDLFKKLEGKVRKEYKRGEIIDIVINGLEDGAVYDIENLMNNANLLYATNGFEETSLRAFTSLLLNQENVYFYKNSTIAYTKAKLTAETINSLVQLINYETTMFGIITVDYLKTVIHDFGVIPSHLLIEDGFVHDFLKRNISNDLISFKRKPILANIVFAEKEIEEAQNFLIAKTIDIVGNEFEDIFKYLTVERKFRPDYVRNIISISEKFTLNKETKLVEEITYYE